MEDKIRLRVWLGVVGPIAAIGAIALYLLLRLLAAPLKERPAATSPSGAWESKEVGKAAVEPLTPAIDASAQRHAPVSPPASTSSATAASSDDSGDSREPIPELDAIYWRPRGSEGWTAEQKDAYRQKAFDDLDTRERTLDAEIAAAHRSGDTGTEQRKTATVSYLRRRRAEMNDLMARASASSAANAVNASGDAGP